MPWSRALHQHVISHCTSMKPCLTGLPCLLHQVMTCQHSITPRTEGEQSVRPNARALPYTKRCIVLCTIPPSTTHHPCMIPITSSTGLLSSMYPFGLFWHTLHTNTTCPFDLVTHPSLLAPLSFTLHTKMSKLYWRGFITCVSLPMKLKHGFCQYI